MSIDLITKYISDTIKYLEQGEFQTFCEQFFPIYNNKYKNLVRKGKTASGKTRPGTPDSIITDKSGNNIAFE
ncbi:MAG: hypothetical protein IID03_04350, partial [Candidatus Dadabacteria bacterium]|nr:hypothetical protein [Candidatus Dadabacteria bacterium]